MLYIHKLKDLNPKSIEIESTMVIRELKQKYKIPVSVENVKKHFAEFFVLKSEMEAMRTSLELVPLTIKEIEALLSSNKYEQVNCRRAISILQEMPLPLKNSLDYAQQIFEWQESVAPYITPLFNRMAVSKNEIPQLQQQINPVYYKILRNNEDIYFNFIDLVNEGEVSRIASLVKGMEESFLYCFRIEEQNKKLQAIQARFKNNEIEYIDNIHNKIIEIKTCLEQACSMNLRLINWYVIMYSYNKWVKSV